MGAADYSLRSLLDNKAAVGMGVFQAPGSNAIQISENVHKVMAELKQTMPDGVDYEIVYDTTQFVRASIESVIHTLLEAIALVVVVVIVFLQTWRASIIPLVAVPVSIVGTFAVMYVFGFSINALSLFGLVLAIGIVVDEPSSSWRTSNAISPKVSHQCRRPIAPCRRSLGRSSRSRWSSSRSSCRSPSSPGSPASSTASSR